MKLWLLSLACIALIPAANSAEKIIYYEKALVEVSVISAPRYQDYKTQLLRAKLFYNVDSNKLRDFSMLSEGYAKAGSVYNVIKSDSAMYLVAGHQFAFSLQVLHSRSGEEPMHSEVVPVPFEVTLGQIYKKQIVTKAGDQIEIAVTPMQTVETDSDQLTKLGSALSEQMAALEIQLKQSIDRDALRSNSSSFKSRETENIENTIQRLKTQIEWIQTISSVTKTNM